MPRYRKRPVEIEARHYGSSEQRLELAQWAHGYVIRGHSEINIPTLEGTMRASVGDWIIKGVHGEFYPVKPDIFDATYEEA